MRKLVFIAALLTACQGNGEGTTPPPDTVTPENNGVVENNGVATNNGTTGVVELPEFRPPSPAMRRLSALEYENTIHDIFGVNVDVPDELEPDTSVNGFTAVGNAQLATSRLGVEQYETAALDIAAQVMGSPGRVVFLDCAPDGADDAACMIDFVRKTGPRVLRRPLSEDEVQRYGLVALRAAQKLNDFWTGLEYALAAMLQSPHFLYRTEWGLEADAPKRRKLTSFELASRLSYFLTASTPDVQLFDAAASGELDTPEQVRTQAERLLEHPRAQRGLRALWVEFLGLGGLDSQIKDPVTYPNYSPELSSSMREETLRLIEYYAASDRDFREIFDTRTTFVDARLADLYGLDVEPGPGEFVKVELPEDGLRRGILGHASLLSANAHAVATSPTHRGLFVRQSLLCQAIPPPPPNVDTSIDEYGGEGQTLRDRLSDHMENEGCSGCHLLMDPIGFGFEHFDAIGQYRTQDNGVDVDATGDLDGKTFEHAAELAELVADHPNAATCLVRKVYRHALGHIEADEQEILIRDLADGWKDDGYRFRELLLDLVTSEAFTYVEGE